jgi:hypothetical protein
MRFLVGWTVKLGFLAVVCLAVSGNLKIQLPETVLGYEVPPDARQWVDRTSQITDMGARTQASFKQIADSLR